MSAPILLALRVLLVISLYAFLGWALYTLWRSIRSGSQEKTDQNVPSLSLILTGDEGQSKIYQFKQNQVIIGRDPGSDLSIDDKTISSRHARLYHQHGQWWVNDLQSTNGTFINLEAVEEPTVITVGDELRCGKVQIEISMDSTNL